MLRVLSVKPEIRRLETNALATFLPLPDIEYYEMEDDLDKVTHLKSIKGIRLETSPDGVIIKCHNQADGLLAAVYLLKKWEYETQSYEDYDEDDEDCGYEDDDDDYPCGDEPYDPVSRQDEEDEADNIIYNEDGTRLLNIPIVTFSEFNTATSIHQSSFGFNQFRFSGEMGTQNRDPFWLKGNYPLIIADKENNPYSKVEVTNLKATKGRFVIYIIVELDANIDFDIQENVGLCEQRILFELEFGMIYINKPDMSYYTLVLDQSTRYQGYELSADIDRKKLIEDLQAYRGKYFQSVLDVTTLVDRVIKRKKIMSKSKSLIEEDFDIIFELKNIRKKKIEESESNARKQLNDLVGMQEVKNTLFRIIDTMKFNKLRKMHGFKTGEIHNALVFAGNPGSAKTTVARIFADILYQENILESLEFIEASRKDLVGQYVGWTANIVAQVFKKAEGGVLFIDEAYSLINSGNYDDGYSGEAMSEIIRQMENNPSTLVIFAGYLDEMQAFVNEANPGLRSRITHIVEFKDYNHQEMFDIFVYLMQKEQFQLEDINQARELIYDFVSTMNFLGSKNLGNGRMMRKLFKTAVSYKAQRKDNDLSTLKTQDILNAAQEIYNSELIVTTLKARKIGF